MGADEWVQIKLRHVSDPRYDAVNSSSLRESLFTSYLANLSSSTGTAKSDKAARAAASLREREEQVRGEKERLSRNASAARGAMGREEGEREFKTLLIDSVRDHEVRFFFLVVRTKLTRNPQARWDSVAPSLERDPRFEASGLNPHDKRRMFDAHLSELYTKRVAAVESLFLTHFPTLTTPFTDVLPLLSASPHVARLIGTDFDRLEGLFDAWRRKRVALARKEFDDLLKESPILEHWGRLQKKEEGGEGKKIVDEDEDEDEGAIDISEMAKQVDSKAIHAVLKVSPFFGVCIEADERCSTISGTSSSTTITRIGTSGSRTSSRNSRLRRRQSTSGIDAMLDVALRDLIRRWREQESR